MSWKRTPRQQDPAPSENPYQDAKRYALRILQRRDYTQTEMRRKLVGRKYETQVIASLLEELVESGFINDARYAEIYAASALRNKGHAPLRIKRDLMRRGLAETLIEATLQETGEDAEQKALDTSIEKKLRAWGSPSDEKGRKRWASYLQRQGFRAGLVFEALDKLKTL